MATIGDLVINLTANAQGVADGCSSALGALGGFASSAVSGLGGVVGWVASAASPLLAAAGAAASFAGGLFESAQGLAAVEGIPTPFAPIQASMGALQGALASVLVPSIQEFNLLMYDVADVIMSFFSPAVEQTSAICTDWGEILRSYVSGALDLVYEGLIAAAWGMTHWQEIALLAGTQIALTVVQIGASIAHFFTAELPVLFNWFAENWQQLFTDAAMFVGTVFQNIGTNIMNVMQAVWDYIASGGTAELQLAWTPLLDGFESTVAKIPDLPKRMTGELEQALIDERDRLANEVGGGLAEALAKAPGRRRELPGVPGPTEAPGPQQLFGETSKEVQNAALQRNSKEAVDALVAAANGGRATAAERQAAAAEKALEEAARQNDLLEDIRGELKDRESFTVVSY